MYKIDLCDTAVGTFVVTFAGALYGSALLNDFPGIVSKEMPKIAATAFAISYLAQEVLYAALGVAEEAGVLGGRRNVKIALAFGVTAWGAASIVAFRQLNLIANLGTAILSGFLALRVIQIAQR